jgi:hypothetical protein
VQKAKEEVVFSISYHAYWISPEIFEWRSGFRQKSLFRGPQWLSRISGEIHYRKEFWRNPLRRAAGLNNRKTGNE